MSEQQPVNNPMEAKADRACSRCAALEAALREAIEYARVECLNQGMEPDGLPKRLTAQVIPGGPIAVFDVKAARILLGDVR